MSGTVIASRGIVYRYPRGEQPALAGADLNIGQGECVVLCGKSGCGKTTLTRLINGLIPSFFGGELRGECDTFGLRAGQAAIESYVPLVGSVFQNPKTQYFNVDTTAELAFPCENMGMEPERIRRRIVEISRMLQLTPLLGKSIFHLSGGEKQRIAFGSACMLSPALLVLDEPTSNLDQRAMEQLHDMIRAMKEKGTTVVIAEHRLSWIADQADRYLYFDEGRLCDEWTAEEFRRLPQKTLWDKGLRAADLGDVRKVLAKKKSRGRGDTRKREAVLLRDVTIGYRKQHPIRKIDELRVCHGEIVGLMGHNGAGKSTLAQTLCGLLPPLEGKILWQGHPAGKRELNRHSFMVMQDVNYQLFSDSVEQEILLGTREERYLENGGEEPSRLQEVMEELDLTGFRGRHPHSLSGGQKQRVAIASAILSDKDFFVFDEPTSGLDYFHMQQVGKLLRWLRDQGKAILVITHDEELAARWCDRIVGLDDENSRREDEKICMI